MKTFGFRHCGERVVGKISTIDGAFYAPWRVTRDDVLNGNDPRKRYSLGLVYVAGELYPIRDVSPDDVEALEAGQNYVLDEPIKPEDIGEQKYQELLSLGAAADKRSRDARAKDQTDPRDLVATTSGPSGSSDKRSAGKDDACDIPASEKFTDARQSATHSALFGSGRTASFAEIHKNKHTQTSPMVQSACVAGAKDAASVRQQVPTRSKFFDTSPTERFAALRAGGKQRA